MRPSFLEHCLRLGSVALLLLGCAPQPRIYSIDPVDRDGQAIPLAQVKTVVRDGGQRLSISSDGTLRLEDGVLWIDGPEQSEAGDTETAPGLGVPLAQVVGLEILDPEGELRWIDIRTPDDLLEFETLPRLEEIVLKTGEAIDLRNPPRRADWSANGLAIVVHSKEKAQEAELSFLIDEIHSVRLYEPDLASATIRSPAFWVATAAAVGLFILVTGDADKRDVAVE